MNDLVERYIHQVGRYLPKNERADIEAELRSLIQDQLDDRFEAAPTQAQVASVLAELGSPRQIAASYNREQYLVGPDLYPYLLTVLRYVWMLAPISVIFLNIFGALVSPQGRTLTGFLLETIGGVIQVVFVLSAVVVLIFALIQRMMAEHDADELEQAFNPLELPKVDEPGLVDRFEAVFGMVMGTIFLLMLLYFVQVGGLTLRFNLSDPGEVIAFPMPWMLLLIAIVTGQVLMEAFALWRGRWGVVTWLAETALEVFGVICLYLAVIEPVIGQIISDNPALISGIAQFIAGAFAIFVLVNRGIKFLRLWHYRQHSPTPFTMQIIQ